MKTIIFSLFFWCSNALIAQTISDITFRVVDNKTGETTIQIGENDRFMLDVSTNMTLYLTKDGQKEQKYASDSKKSSLVYMSYMLDEEKHEFNLVEGTSPDGGGSKTYYSLLLEKVYESDNITLLFSPIFMFEQYNPASKYNSDTVKYLTRNHYLSYGKGILSKHDGTVASLSNRLAFAACMCTSKNGSEACRKTIRDKFAESRKVLSKEEMIEIIQFWEGNCTITK